MEKSPDAFRTISEVSDDLDLPQHVLRFWETRFQQIRPLKRAGGRRYYRPADVVLLRAIRQLLYNEGYTIKGVQRLLKEQGAKGLAAAGADLGVATEPSFGDGFDFEDAAATTSDDGGLDIRVEPSLVSLQDAPGTEARQPPADTACVMPSRDGASLTHATLREALVLVESSLSILRAARSPRS